MEEKGSAKNQQHTATWHKYSEKPMDRLCKKEKKCPYCSFEVLYSLFWQIVVEDNPHVLALFCNNFFKEKEVLWHSYIPFDVSRHKIF
jgi:hypothetical protein